MKGGTEFKRLQDAGIGANRGDITNGDIKFSDVNDTAIQDRDISSSSSSNKWAVLVGIADYPGTQNDLPYSAKDAMDMRNTLINNGWELNHILVLLNSSATKPNIQDAIENWLGSNVSAKDSVLFFYSGHGTYYSESQYNPDGDSETDGKDEYLCSYSEAMQIEDFIADGELDQYLNTLESEHIVVIIDSCFSGGMTKAVVFNSEKEITGMDKSPVFFSCDILNHAAPKTIKKPKVHIIDGLSRDIRGNNRVILMACNDDEASMEVSGLENGIFTHYILEGLQCMADTNTNGSVSAEEAFDYAEPLVSYLSMELGHAQHPQIYDSHTGELQVTNNLSNVLITVDDSGSAGYTSIQAAVDAAESCDTVYIYDGTYTESVLLNKPITLQGEGADAVTINGDGSPGVLMLAHHALVTGLTIEGAGSYSGIEVDYTRWCNISDNNVSNNGCGIQLYHSSNNVIADNIGNDNINLDGVSLWNSCCNNSIINNTVNSNRWSGVYLHSGCNNNSIINNIAKSNRDPGIYLIHSSNNNTLTGNTANSNNNHGIKIDRSFNNTLTGNTANENEHGIYFRSSCNNTLTSNTCSNNSYGISIETSTEKNDYNNIIETTNMVNNRPVYYLFDKNGVVYDGIEAGLLTLAYCSGCTIKNSNINNGDGIQLFFSSNNRLINTIACENNYNGVYLYYSDNNTITNSNVSNNTNHGFYLYYSGNNTINDAVVISNNKQGFRIDESDNNEISDVNTSLNGDDGIYLKNSCYNNISGSTISSNRHGIKLDVSNHHSNINSNDIFHNREDGFELYRSDNNSITNNNASMHVDHAGIYVDDYSDNNTVHNNTANNNRYGIRLDSNNNNNITNNRLDGNNRVGFQFDFSTSYYNNIKDNLVNGDYYYHYVNEKGITIQDIFSTGDDPSNLGWVSIINCTDISAKNFTLANNDYDGSGLFIYKTRNSTFEDINATKNRYGIYLKESDNNTITNSNVSNNTNHGFYLYYSGNSTINDAVVISNNKQGFRIDESDNNEISDVNTSLNGHDGIYLKNSCYNNISGSTISSNRHGIKLDFKSP